MAQSSVFCKTDVKILLLKWWVKVDQLGCAVEHLVEALRYKPEGCGFDS
jgi:hypothetical protein